MKKILVVMPYFHPHKGGSQKYAEELYATLIRLYPKQYQVDVLCYNTDKSPDAENYRGMRIYRIPCWQIIVGRFALPNPWFLFNKLRFLTKNKYYYVNAQLIFFDPAWWVWLYARLIGAKSIFTEHVASYPVHQNKLVEIIAKVAERTIGSLALNRYDLITVTNKAAGDFLKNDLGLKRKTNLIYGGVDTKYFSEQVGRKGFKTDDLIITYVGRLIWTKGITYLYEAIRAIINKVPDNTYFIIAGGGELEDSLKKMIKRDRLSKRIFLTGFISYKEVRNLLGISDIFINPSHHNEGFPNTILEAGASENFDIATDNAGTSEIIQDKKTGLLIPQRNQEAIEKSLVWAIENPGKRKEIAGNLRRLIASKFDWEIIARDYKTLLDAH